MCNLTLSYCHLNMIPAGKIFLKNNPHLHNVKMVLLNLKFDTVCEINLLIIGMICKIFDDIFTKEDYENYNYEWRENYVKIFEILNIKKRKR